MAFPGRRRVQVLEAERPNRPREMCGSTPSNISVIKWADSEGTRIEARDSQESHYFCSEHRPEAERIASELRAAVGES